MGKTGIELPKIPDTGIDSEQLKAHLDFHTQTNKINKELKEKWVDMLFSANFLVFLITVFVIISGFLFMSREDAIKADIIDYWKLILPVVTTYIGYAIGKGKSGSI